MVVPGKGYYVRTTTVSADGKLYYDDGNGFTIYLVTPPQTGGSKPPAVFPAQKPTICSSATETQINAQQTTPGSVNYHSAGIDWAYYEASLINRIETFSTSTYMAPWGIISQVKETYYRKCITLDHPGFENPGYPGTYWFGPTIGGRIFSLYPGAIYNPYYTLPNRAENSNWKFLEWELIRTTTVELISCDDPPPFEYLGSGSPPPPPPPPRKRMSNCCDCNTIASIVENQSIVQLVAQQKLFEDLKDHIDKRALEIIIKDLEHLKALDFEQFLRAIMQRINESESNLWNGPQQ